MDLKHVNIIMFFISFSILLTGLTLSLKIKQQFKGYIIKEFRYTALFLMIILVLDLVLYYIYMFFGEETNEWDLITLTHENLYLSSIMLFIFRLPFLVIEFTGRTISSRTRKTINILCIFMLIINPMVNLYPSDIKSLFVIRYVLFIMFSILIPLVSGIYLIFKSFKKEEKEYLILGIILVLITYTIIDDMILGNSGVLYLYPFGILFFGIFFISYFIKNWKSSTHVSIERFIDSYGLSNREVDVLHLLLEGQNKYYIADKLYISSNTVKSHISNIYRKLKVSSRMELFQLINN